MSDKTKNDWLVASIAKPEYTLGDFDQMGLNPNNTQLLDKEAYKSNDKIQQVFQNEAGEFDDDSFDQFYDIAKQTYNDFSRQKFDSTILNEIYYAQEDIHAPKGAKRLNNSWDLVKVKNPFGTKTGIEGFNIKTAGDRSVREIAQTQKVLNPETGKLEEYTPNDLGLFGSIAKPTMVLATYDEDGEHYDEDLGRNVSHSKGEFKYNSQGMPQYELLGDREVYGREVLSAWDVATTDGSAANKYDFMDSDGLTKSLTGTMAKTVATIAPYLIPGVGQWYGAATVGSAILFDLLPVLSKATGSLFIDGEMKNTEFGKAMNKLEGVGRTLSTKSSSDQGRSSMINVESLSNMMSDVFGQLAQQRIVSKIPMLLGQTGKEAQVFSKVASKYGADMLDDASRAIKSFKGPTAVRDKANYLRNRFGFDPEIAKVLDQWDNWSSASSKAMGIAYMAGISSTGMMEEAKTHGLNDVDSSLLFLGTLGGFTAFMTKFNFAHWAIRGMGLDDVGGMLKGTIKNRMPEILKTSDNLIAANESKIAGKVATDAVKEEIQDQAKEGLTKKAIGFFNQGKNLGKEVGNKVSAILENSGSLGNAMLSESMEEMSEEAMQDGLKFIYNGLSAAGLASTDKSQVEAFGFDQAGARYMMSALGGAMGGSIAGLQAKIAGEAHGNLPPTLKKEITSAVLHGYGDKLQAIVDKWYKDEKLGSTALTVRSYTPENNITGQELYEPVVAKDDVSQNEFVYRILSAEIQLAKDAIMQEGLDASPRLNDIYNERTETFLDYRLNTGITDDLDELASKVVDIHAKIKATEEGIKDATSAEGEDNKAKLKPYLEELKVVQEEIAEIIGGERAVQYQGEALFTVNPEMHAAFGIKDRDTFSFSTYKKKYDELKPEEKQDIDEQYDVYNKLEKRKQMRVAKAQFDELNTSDFNAKLPELGDYGRQRQAFYEGAVANPDEAIKFYTSLKNEDAVDRLTPDQLPKVALKEFNEEVESENGDKVVLGFLDLVSAETHVNPALRRFIETQLSQPILTNSQVTPDIFFEEVLGDKIEALEKVDVSNFTLQNLDFDLGIPIRSKLKSLSVWSLEETFAQLREAVGSEKFKKRLNELTDFYNQPLSDEDIAKVEDAIVSTINDLENDFIGTRKNENDEEVVRISGSFLKGVSSLKAELDSKSVNPLYEYVAALTAREGRPELANLINIVDHEFNNLSNKESAAEYIIDNKVSKESLEYGLNLLDKIKAVIVASTDWNRESVHRIGYNAALNATALKNGSEDHEILNTIAFEGAAAINTDLETLKSKMQFLLDLHGFNSDGNIRELKLTGAVMPSLYLRSIGPDSTLFKYLESLDINLSEVTTEYDNASQLKENLLAIDSPAEAKISLKATTEAFKAIRVEKDKIEQAFYKAVNSREDRLELIDKIIKNLPVDDAQSDKDTLNFSPREVTITPLQEVLYLGQVISVDPKQFYKDFVGDLSNAENQLKNDKYAPFYGQEHVLKQLYWQMTSNLKDSDVFRKLARRIMPMKGDISGDLYKAKQQFFDHLYEKPKLRNAQVLYGMPGAGKTTSTLYYLTKIAEKYNLNVAAYGPYQEQGVNLKKSLEERPNVYNEENQIDALGETILGKEFYAKIKDDLEKANVDTYTPTNKEEHPTESTLLETITYQTIPGDNNTETKIPVINFSFNPKNPDVIKFLENKSRVIEVEGKVPNLIIIDEATHIHGPILELFDVAISQHNTNSKDYISMYLVGDKEQRGTVIDTKSMTAKDNITDMTVLTTPVLSQSLRNRFNVKNKNINMIRTLRHNVEKFQETKNINQIQTLLRDGLLFDYVDDELHGLVGEKIVDTFSENEVKNLYAKAEGKVAIITYDKSSTLMQIIKNDKDLLERTVVHTPDKVQGLEYDAVIIDVQDRGKLPTNVRDLLPVYESLELMYTLVSRSKKATLIKAPFLNQIRLRSTDTDVKAQKIDLNPDVINSFKAFTLENIEASFANLEDLDFGTSEKPEKKPEKIEDVNYQDEEVVSEQLESLLGQVIGQEDDLDLPVDTKGDVIDTQEAETRPISYTHHEKLNIGYDRDGRIRSLITPGQDLAAVYTLLNKPTSFLGDKKITDIEVIGARKELKNFKTAILNYYRKQSLGENTGPLLNFLADSGVSNNILSKLNLKKITAAIEVKSYDFNLDRGNHDTPVAASAGGLISYLTIDIDTNTKAVKEGYPEFIRLSVSALPNINNPNVKKRKGVLDAMKDLYQRHTEIAKKEGVELTRFHFKPEVKLADILNPSSNVYLWKKNVKTKSYDQFIDDKSELVVTDPLIIISPNIINLDEEVVKHQFKNFNSRVIGDDGIINIHSKVLVGKPVMFVSYDKTLKKEQLPSIYSKQLNTQAKQRLTGAKVDPGTVRMVMLNKKGVKFSDWFNANIDIHKVQTEEGININAQRRAYANDYAAASMLASFINFEQRFKGSKVFTESEFNKLNGQINTIIRNMLPLATGKTLTDYLFAGESRVDIAPFIERHRSDIETFKTEVFEDAPEATVNAIEYMIALDLLKDIKDNKVVQATDEDGDSLTVPTVQGKTLENSGLYRMVTALRLAILGGRYQEATSEFNEVSGLFTAKDIGTGDYEDLLKNIEKIIAYKFPDGIHMNPVLRTRTEENSYEQTPFVVEAGNSTGDFEVGVDVQTPTIYINLDNLDKSGSIDKQLQAAIELEKIRIGYAYEIDQEADAILKRLPNMSGILRNKIQDLRSTYEQEVNVDKLSEEGLLEFRTKINELLATHPVVVKAKNNQGFIVVNGYGTESSGKYIFQDLSDMAKEYAQKHVQEQYSDILIKEQLDRETQTSTYLIQLIDENGREIVNFVYDNGFSPVNVILQNPNTVYGGFDLLLKLQGVFEGSKVESHYQSFVQAYNNAIEGKAPESLKDKQRVTADYLALSLFLKQSNQNLLPDLRKSFEDLLNHIKEC